MSVIKISPLGAALIVIITEHWNKSTDLTGKLRVKEKILSDKTLQIHDGLDKLFDLVNKEMQRLTVGGKLVEPDMIELQEAIGRALHADKSSARGEIAYHFSELFKAGQFEKLLVPEFLYELPPKLKNESQSPFDRLSPEDKIAIAEMG